MDLASCGGLACSEIRAAGAAECRSPSGGLPWGRRHCARKKARASAEMVFPGGGARCVDRVFDACYGSDLDGDPTAAGTPFAALLDEERRQLARAAAQLPPRST